MFDEARLKYLISAYFDQALESGEKRELEAMLLGSSQARLIFLEYAEWNGLAREWALRAATLGFDSEIPAAGGRSGIPSSVSFRTRRKLLLGVGIAACVLITFLVFHKQTDQGQEKTGASTPEPAATVTGQATNSHPYADHGSDVAMLGQSTGVVWSDGTIPRTVGSPLPKGWVRIKEGTLRLDFYSGATVILDGPASLELLSTDLVRLEKGELTANVPPPAEGFTVLSQALRIVDRGTEFGVKVERPGDCEVHVFKGKVELQEETPGATTRELLQGNAFAIRNGQTSLFQANRQSFTDPADLQRADVVETDARWKSWQAKSEEFRSTPGLLVYFNFENMTPGNPFIHNMANGAPYNSFGTAIGCEKLSGRWPGKGAIGFSKTSDRMRFLTSGTTSSLTLMAWVRVDSLIKEHNSLLTMSPEEVGELHWKIGKSGQLLLGLRADKSLRFSSWERLESPIVISERDLGRWMHFAAVIDGESGTMKHYVNGELVALRAIVRPTPVRLGLANLGNFDRPLSERDNYVIGRSFNGRMDEFALFNRSLSKEEIREGAQ